MSAIVIAIDLEKQRELITTHYRQSAKELAEVGRLLLETQDSLEGQSFEAFINTLPFSRHSAFNFIRLYKHVLKHGDVILAIEQIRISAWYVLPPENNEAVQWILEKAHRGEVVTKKEAKIALSSVTYKDERQEQAMHKANEISTPYVMSLIRTGAVPDNVTGEDVPLEDADATLILLGAEQDKYERIQRHAPPVVQPLHSQRALTVKLERIQDNRGRWRLALPENVPAYLIDKQITFYIESEAAA